MLITAEFVLGGSKYPAGQLHVGGLVRISAQALQLFTEFMQLKHLDEQTSHVLVVVLLKYPFGQVYTHYDK